MILYEGIKHTPNEAAKAIALYYGQQAIGWELDQIPGLQYDRMTELERTKLANRIVAVLDRLDSELEFGKIIKRKVVTAKHQRLMKKEL